MATELRCNVCGKLASEHPGGLFCCPFCGGETRLNKNMRIKRRDTFSIRCTQCLASNATVYGRSKAITAWNTRKADKALLDACKKALRRIPIAHISSGSCESDPECLHYQIEKAIAESEAHETKQKATKPH